MAGTHTNKSILMFFKASADLLHCRLKRFFQILYAIEYLLFEKPTACGTSRTCPRAAIFSFQGLDSNAVGS